MLFTFIKIHTEGIRLRSPSTSTSLSVASIDPCLVLQVMRMCSQSGLVFVYEANVSTCLIWMLPMPRAPGAPPKIPQPYAVPHNRSPKAQYQKSTLILQQMPQAASFNFKELPCLTFLMTCSQYSCLLKGFKRKVVI